MKCPYCNAENTEQDKVCKKCFAALTKNLSDNTKENSDTDRDTNRNRKRSDT